MKIALIVEGRTEKAFLPMMRVHLQNHLQGRMPRLEPHVCDGRIPTGEKLKRTVENLLSGRDAADHVIALTDVYTGSRPPDFVDAGDAKAKMRDWVGPEIRFHPHAAQYDFEAWLLPYWADIQRLAGCDRGAPVGNPETVNHDNPPAHRIGEIFRIGSKHRKYIKTRDAARILRDNDLSLAINQCDELKSLINTVLLLCGGSALP